MKTQLTRVVALRLYWVLIFIISLLIFLLLREGAFCKENLFRYEVSSSDEEVQTYSTTNEDAGNIFDHKSSKSSVAEIQTKNILYWTKMFRSNNFYLGDAENVFQGCPVSACIGTDNKNYLPVEEFDAVLFHGPEMNFSVLPKKRSPHQRYIFADMETQMFHPIPKSDRFNDFFNWTMTYRRDSDLMRPYAVVRNITTNEVMPPNIPMQWIDVSKSEIPEELRYVYRNKNKMAAWFVSHCDTNSNREEIVEQLENYIEIDVYGACGKFQCPRSDEEFCFRKLESEYYFYLSFENTLCYDYVTEKAYAVLQYNVIPIVYGRANYETFLPPNSYIDLLSFKSIEELAKFLLELSQDEARYLSYFQWKTFYKIEEGKKYIACELCKALHEPNKPRQVVQNLYEWWTDDTQCLDRPKIY